MKPISYQQLISNFTGAAKLFGGSQAHNNDTRPYPSQADMINDKLMGEYEKTKELFPDEYLEPFILLDQMTHQVPYTSIRMNQYQNSMKKICHNGQRKLFLCELQHLTEVLDSTDEPALVIYAGAAPSNHSPMLGSLFPNCKFIFVDPNEYNLYFGKFHNSHYSQPGLNTVYMSISAENKKMYQVGSQKLMVHYSDLNKIISADELTEFIGWDKATFIKFILETDYQYYLLEEIFTDYIAEVLNEIILKYDGKVIFWSDIRTAKNGKDPTDDDIIYNTAMMTSWLLRMTKNVEKNFWAMLKFRPPFGFDKVDWEFIKPMLQGSLELGIDFENYYKKNKMILFFRGDVYFQCWHPIDSAETRLWCNLEDIRSPLIPKPLKSHEEKCFAYNMLYRFGRKFKSPYSQFEGVDHCGDCTIEATIWNNYVAKFNKEDNQIIKLIYGLGNITGRPLNRYPHGKF